MNGRLNDFGRFSGGQVLLTPTANRQALFRYVPARPCIVSVQLSYVLVGTEQDPVTTFPTLSAAVAWSVGSGTQTANVDVPTAFTISAAEIVEVQMTLTSDPGASVRVFGVAVPCESPHARRAVQTTETTTNGGGDSLVLAVPQFATAVRAAYSDITVSPNMLFRWSSRSDAFFDSAVQSKPGEDELIVPGNARGLRLTNQSASNCRVKLMWQLSL